MNKLESSLHLYQPPLYCDEKGRWHVSYASAVNGCGGRLTWGLVAILSILSFNYPCGDRTLLNEVKRKPWAVQTLALLIIGLIGPGVLIGFRRIGWVRRLFNKLNDLIYRQ